MEQILSENYQRVQHQITDAAQRAGRNPKEIKLIAVTKTVSHEIIRLLHGCGVGVVGENRVQDAKQKYQVLADLPLEWHMIGHLQRNKVKDACKIFSYFHSIDSVRLAQEINREAEKIQKKITVLLQVNTSLEETKHGFTQENLCQQLPQLAELSFLRFQGLMTMAPFTENTAIIRECFQKTRQLAETINESGMHWNLTELSMGMSQDFAIAIEEGATMVRVGSALFQGLDKES